MIDVEVFGAEASSAHVSASARRDAAVPSLQQMRRLCTLAAGAVGVREGHIAIEFVEEPRITALNARYRALSEPTDVLSFPVDGAETPQVAGELGDVVICLAHTADVREAIVHGVLHLVGMDHETDDGEMLALQREILQREDS